jgi:glycine cleavage system regulatory protein
MRGGDVVHAEDMIGGGVTGSSYMLLKEGLDKFNTTPVEMDENMNHVNISAAGKNRAGLVAMLAKHVAENGGNITHSKMTRLGSEFIIQMHVAIPPSKAKEFLKSLKKNHLTNELNIQATKLTQRVREKKNAMMGIRVHCVGLDRPGMLAAVSEKVASKGMSIEDITTKLRISSSGQREVG